MAKISEMREVCQPACKNGKAKKGTNEHWFSGNITRRYSIYFTWLFAKLGLSANAVTFIMVLLGLAGIPLLIPHVLWINIAGAIALMLAEILDCVDGEVARWTKKSSLKGVYLDLVSHSLCNGIVSSLCALHLYALNKEVKYLIMAFAAYYIAQSGYCLKEEFRIIMFNVPRPEKQNSGKTVSQNRSFANKVFSFCKSTVKYSIVNISVDHIMVRLLTITAIMLSYLGTQKPMIFLAWWFIIAGVVSIVIDISKKFFIDIPHEVHKKQI